MKISYPVPSPEVSRYVDGVLVIENGGSEGEFKLPLFANGRPTILFHTAKGRLKQFTTYFTLFGQTLIPETLSIDGNFTLIACFLIPSALSALFGMRADELTDNPVDFTLLPGVKQLQEELLNAGDTAGMIALINCWLIRQQARQQRNIDETDFAVAQIIQRPDKNILRSIQHDIGFTERSLQRLFQDHIGVSPNQFRKIIQFQHAFKQLQKSNGQNLSAIAYQNGYADQSHFNRDFRLFTNLTPKQYLDRLI